MSQLTNEQRTAFLDANDGWAIEGENLTKTFAFADFNEAVGFVTRVAMLAEVADHHPDIDIRWNKVTITLSTHSEDALTAQDTDLAGRIEAL